MQLFAPWSISRLTASLCVILLGAVFALVGYTIWSDYREVRHQTFRATQNLANVLAEHAVQALAATDQALLGIVNEINIDRLADPAYRPMVHKTLRDRLLLSSGIYAFDILDADGRLLHSSRTPDIEPADLSDRPVFRLLNSDPTKTTAAGHPELGRMGPAKDKWTLNVAHRLTSREGRFAGIVVAAMALESFQHIYDLLRAGTYGTIGLFHDDGHMIVSSPFHPDFLHLDFSRLPPFNGMLKDADSGTFDAPPEVDGRRRLAAYRKVPGRDFVVFVGIPEANAFAHWQEETARLLVLAAVIAGLVIGLTAMTYRVVSRWRRESTDNEQRLARLAAAADQARAEIEAVFNAMSDGLVMLDRDFGVTYMNPQAEHILGDSGAIVGRNLWDIYPQARNTLVWTEYQTVMTQRRPREFTFFYPPLDKWFEIRGFPHKDGMAIYFRDITKRQRMEEQLRQAQKMDAIGQLTGGVAHDFNNLLTVILGNAEMLAERLSRDPLLGRVAELARDAAERAAELTQRLLAFARRQSLDPSAIDVNAKLDELEPLIRRTLGAQIDIEFRRASSLWPALVDPSQLQTAILNLAINARDAMPDGGHLCIATDRLSFDATKAKTMPDLQPGDYVTVTVSDTGIGMTREVAAQAFEPFFTTKDIGKGSGMGLSMVYGFIKQSNGHVTLQSEPGQGTTVTLYLPRAVEACVECPATERQNEPRGHERILLVEDDPMVRQYTVRLLRELGYEVSAATSGTEGLALFGRDRFDLVISDIMLPGGMSGRQMAEHIRQQAPQQRILFVSGYSDETLRDDDIQLLQKPFRKAGLAAKLREVIDGAAAA